MPWLIFFPYLASERGHAMPCDCVAHLIPALPCPLPNFSSLLTGRERAVSSPPEEIRCARSSLPHDVRLSPRHSFGLCGTERGRDHDAFPGFVLVPGAHRRIALCGGSGFLGVVWVCGAWGRCGVCSGIHVRVLLMGEGFNISPP